MTVGETAENVTDGIEVATWDAAHLQIYYCLEHRPEVSQISPLISHLVEPVSYIKLLVMLPYL